MSWLVITLGATALALVVPFVAGRAVATLSASLDPSTSTLERGLSIGTGLPVGISFLCGLFGSLAVPRAIWLVWPSMPYQVALALVCLTTAAITAVGYRAWLLGLAPLVREVRGEPPTVPESVRWQRRVLWVVAFATLALVVAANLLDLHLVPVLDPAVSVDTVTLGLLMVVMGLYTWLGYPLALPATPGYSPLARDPTPVERARIERCYDRFERSPPRIRVRPGSGLTTDVDVAGTGVRESITVGDSLLSGLDDEGLAVALAQADERARRPVFRHLYAVLIMVPVALVWLVVALAAGEPVRPALVGLAGASVVALVLGVLLRRRVYRADRFAAEHLGPDTVRRTYEQVGEDLSVLDQEWTRLPVVGTWIGRYRAEPAVSIRLERLGTGD